MVVDDNLSRTEQINSHAPFTSGGFGCTARRIRPHLHRDGLPSNLRTRQLLVLAIPRSASIPPLGPGRDRLKKRYNAAFWCLSLDPRWLKPAAKLAEPITDGSTMPMVVRQTR